MNRKKFLLITITAIGISVLFSLYLSPHSQATDTLVVGNSAPQLTEVPRVSQHFVSGENLIITLEATAEDPNGDSYFMNVCPDSGLPIKRCSTDQLCRSGLAKSGTSVSCEFTLPQNLEDFYITLCDKNDNMRCSGPYGSGFAAPVGESTSVPDVLGATTSQFDNSKAMEISLLTVGMLGMLAAAMCIYALNVFKKIGIQRRPVAAGVSSMVVIGLTFVGLLAAQAVPPSVPEQPDVLGESITLDPIVQRSSKAGLYEIFAGPSVNEDIIFYATENEEFPILKETDAWFEILLPNGDSGWLPATNVRQ